MLADMRRLLCLWMTTCLIAGFAGCHRSTDEVRRRILANEALLSNSFNTGDPTTIDRLVTDDFVGVDTDGSHYDKARLKQFIAHFAHSGGRYSTSDITLRLYGDVAITQGYDHTTRADGIPGAGTAWTDTWIQRDHTWKLVAAEDLPTAQ